LCGAGSQAMCTVWKLLFDSHCAHSLRPSSTQPQSAQPVQNTIAVIHGLVLLTMGIMMPETFWDRSLIINIRLVASCWSLFLHPIEKNVHNSVLKYTLLSYFNEILIFGTDFRRIFRYKIFWKFVQWESKCSMCVEIQADRHVEANSHFSQLCKRPDKYITYNRLCSCSFLRWVAPVY